MFGDDNNVVDFGDDWEFSEKFDDGNNVVDFGDDDKHA